MTYDERARMVADAAAAEMRRYLEDTTPEDIADTFMAPPRSETPSNRVWTRRLTTVAARPSAMSRNAFLGRAFVDQPVAHCCRIGLHWPPFDNFPIFFGAGPFPMKTGHSTRKGPCYTMERYKPVLTLRSDA
jgi:hypothetical protein